MTLRPALDNVLPDRILLVEDDPFVATVALAVLTGAGASTVRVCASGEAAVAVAVDFRPQLVLLDFVMPGIDGRATWQALKACLSPLPPVIFLTARVDPAFYAEIASFNAAGVLAKPFDPTVLVDDICRILALTQSGAKRRPQREPAAKARRLAAVAESFYRSLPMTAARIEASWDRVRAGGWQPDAVQFVLADAHSLAGSAGLFDCAALSAAAHEAERLLLNALKLARTPDVLEMRKLVAVVTALIAACRAPDGA